MKKRNRKKPKSTLWLERDAKRLPVVLEDGTVMSEGQNAVMGVLPASLFTHKKTALRGVTRKGHARMRLISRRRNRRAAKALKRSQRGGERP